MNDFEDDEYEDDDDEVEETSEDVVTGERQIDTVEELEALFVWVAESLERQLRCAPTLGEPLPMHMMQDLVALLDAHERLEVLEDAFFYEDEPDDGRESADLAVLRTQIGGQLDRLRAALVSDGVSRDVETPST